MLYTFELPSINEAMTTTTVLRLFAPEGAEIAVGARLVEVRLTAGDARDFDCPPVGNYHLHSRERVWLRKWQVAPEDAASPGAVLALVSTGPHEPLDAAPARKLRVTVAGIVPDVVGWGDWN
jgi:hypothetical protein